MVIGSMDTDKHDAGKETKSYIMVHKEGGCEEKSERKRGTEREGERD